MISREQRYNELYRSGLVDSIKSLFANKNVNISEEYYVLMADYIDLLDEVKDSMLLNPTEIAKTLPDLVHNIQDVNIGGIYGITDENGIRMNQNLSYEDKKLYFFHELTHALQTRNIDGKEHCSFYNGVDGMFFTEGATQFTAEILYHVSNGTNIDYRQQPGSVRGDNSRTTYSPLSEYQYNGDVLMLLCKTMDVPLPQVLALGYKRSGRETLKQLYESMEGNDGKFDGFMKDLEQIYTVDKAIIYGQGEELQRRGYLEKYNRLMNKVERELAGAFLQNHNTEYVIQNAQEFVNYLTTPELKSQFLESVHELEVLSQGNNLYTNENNMQISNSGEINYGKSEVPQMPNIDLMEMPEGYTINEFGEIIRPEKEEKKEQVVQSGKLSIKQKVAQFLQRNNLFMNLSFVDKFVHNQLDVLPKPTQERAEIRRDNTRENFLNYLSNNGEYRNLPPISRSPEPERLAQMQKNVEQQQSIDDNERG